MGLGVHIRIDAQGYRSGPAGPCGEARDALQFLFGLDVEAQDASFEGGADLGFGFPHAREHHLARVSAGGDHPRKLSAGDDVETRAQSREQVEDRQVRIGLHCIADQHVAARAGHGKLVEGAAEGGARIDVARGAEIAGDTLKRNRFRVKCPCLEAERRHAGLFFCR